MQPNIFKPTDDGYTGRIRLFGIDEVIALVPAEPSDAEKAPDFRVLLDDEHGPRVGAAWKDVGERAGDYVSLEIESPLFAGQTLRAHLFRTDDEGSAFRLSVSRPRVREDRS
ncbi:MULTISPECIES: DUF736 domain-containing protein [Sphingomonadales]|uniref:Uncharacterized conserved protein, DUF736 family n=4 Tax=Sphingomonadales TaxID=204457 RepID=A0A239LHY1_9SPHN|nr:MULTISPECIES: DUF736 domain-containing protein [Sphingomonadales]UBS33896.1 DUF736 domain-containing protein [Altererythrobacter sp. N1]AJA10883.1 hypothetical protein SKP52_20085 [Sphingopyxis fribergensis]AKM11070.1 hypothetical protein AB433_15595 [Croceicoccus naphthovorans]MBB3989491.1 uncharacterized protein (DUF736 family) [Croceicoccus naphthovorans]RIV87114.1 DUF736 domain-containing protein [Aurantiacibacter xanthus]